jgi:uncharacterized membrane protein YfcA
MYFPVSGIEISPFVPVAVGFAIAMFTTPAGVSGAFLLLPFQFTVLGFTAPGVTPTNLLYNVFSTPGGIFSYIQQGDLDRTLVKTIVAGAVPGVVVGSVFRITLFEDPSAFKVFVGVVLMILGANLVVQAATKRGPNRSEAADVPRSGIALLGAGAGCIGGIYGISGGSIIAPVLAGVFRQPVRRIAPAALTATLLTSVAGVASFEVLELLSSGTDPARRPDWLLALLFGAGGAGGGYVGAHLNTYLPERGLRTLLGVLALILAFGYVRPIL